MALRRKNRIQNSTRLICEISTTLTAYLNIIERKKRPKRGMKGRHLGPSLSLNFSMYDSLLLLLVAVVEGSTGIIKL